MGHSIGDGIIVVALAALLVAWLYDALGVLVFAPEGLPSRSLACLSNGLLSAYFFAAISASNLTTSSIWRDAFLLFL